MKKTLGLALIMTLAAPLAFSCPLQDKNQKRVAPHAIPSLSASWKTETVFSNPESVLYDEKRDLFYVSNVAGVPNEKDGKGFISKVSADGQLETLEWVAGMNAPKGMGLYKNTLYVTDIDRVMAIDIKRGKIKTSYQVAGAQFLNDIVISNDGTVYISDMATNVIHRLVGGKVEPWFSDTRLENPNGLAIVGNELVVAAWGKMTDGFKTKVPGYLKAVSLVDKTFRELDTAPIGNLDGLETDGRGGYVATDWMAGKLFHIDASGVATLLKTLSSGSADLEVIPAQSIIVIPMMNDNRLLAYQY